jgi:hypothetical protein
MKRFHFSLRPIAVLRAHREARAMERFAVAVQTAAAAAHTEDTAHARVGASAVALARGRDGSFRATDEALRLVAHQRECSAEAAAVRARTEADAATAQSRHAYIAARRELEAVRRLEAKARTAHRLAAAREEQGAFDEFATRRGTISPHARPRDARKPS